MKARIAEIFKSIQGEGIYLGEEQIFVRFFGCNLSCKFCDTKLFSFSEYEPIELLEELETYGNKYHSISFTGGEPLLQKDFLKEVLSLTRKAGFRNYLETNGTLFRELEEVIDNVDIVAMDLKLPSSSGMGNLWEMHRRFFEVASRKGVFLKAVISQDTSLDDLKEGIRLIKEKKSAAILILQPNANEDSVLLEDKLEMFKEICRREKVNSCVIPQIHKIVGVK